MSHNPQGKMKQKRKVPVDKQKKLCYDDVNKSKSNNRKGFVSWQKNKQSKENPTGKCAAYSHVTFPVGH